ncbi:hypothetical protein [Caedibacter taeniospiralis]|uniref:hypothetical protein n=1 Tax=Caedibacter taeniospiralis TaxID=28907 RepID=UPI0013026378|nr:hypothetical protein [Caedibacter taeniospiralis]
MQNEFNVTITQDKLVDILMHAATREDMASFKAEMKEDISDLRDKMDKDIATLNGRIDKLDSRIDKLDSRIDKLDSRIDSNFKWMMGAIVIAILIPLVSKFIPALH